MTTSDHKKLHVRAIAAEAAYMSGRVRKLAHQLTKASVSDDVGADILERNIDHMGRSVGRRAQGAHAPTQGYVCVDGDFRLRVAQNPTSKVKDHKAHKALRVRACVQAHAGAIDAMRRFTHMSAPFRPGGAVCSKVNKGKRRRFRAILHKADALALSGEVTVATELLKQL